MIDLNDISHSHDRLEIVSWKQMPCVLKIFRSDLDRAQRNIEKQRIFKPIYTSSACVDSADILDLNIFPDRVELLMPYAEGITGQMFSVHASLSVAQTLSDSMSSFLYAELEQSREELVPTLLFKNKLQNVARATSDPELLSLINAAIDVVGMLPDEIIFPVGPCHGDLTLSNIILDMESGITLIDFLDTFLESPLQDVAKLKQDFIYGWSFRHSPSTVRISAKILCKCHYPLALVEIERMYRLQTRLVTLMTLIRIAPYVKDAVTKDWLVASLKHRMEESPI
jgi:hypothetical protein